MIVSNIAFNIEPNVFGITLFPSINSPSSCAFKIGMLCEIRQHPINGKMVVE